MSITTHSITTYTIEDHPAPDLVYDWVRNNWHDLSDHNVTEVIDTLKAFCDHFNVELSDWSISACSDRSEHIGIRFDEFIGELSGIRLWKYLTNNFLADDLLSGNCPFTGVVWDEAMLDPIREFMSSPSDIDFETLMDDCASKLITNLHADTDYIYSDEGLKDTLEANEYEFKADGSIY